MDFLPLVRKVIGRHRASRRGVAAVEFAIMAPVYFMIVLGSIETCSMLFLQQSLEVAAYEGARVAIVPNTATWNVQAGVDSILTARRVNGYTVTVTPANFQSAPYGTFIQVSVKAPCSSNAVSPLLFYSSMSLTGSVQMMKEF